MRENGTVGEKRTNSDWKVWELVTKLRQGKWRGVDHPTNARILNELSDLGFHWDFEKDRGTYAGSGVWYDGDRRRVNPDGTYTGAEDDPVDEGYEEQDAATAGTPGVGGDGAAIGAPPTDAATVQPSTTTPTNWKAYVKQLKDLLRQGVISRKDYNRQMAKVPKKWGGTSGGSTSSDNKKYAGFGDRKSAYAYYDDLFTTMGMPAGWFSTDIKKIIRKAPSETAVLMELRKTPEWQERFKGNEQRIKAGLPPIPEEQYIADETAYKSIMQHNGLPEHFYDGPEDYAKFIAANVSPEQVAQRVNMAGQLAINKDPALWAELKSRGISKGDATAYLLDPERAMPQIEKKLGASEIGAAMKPADLDIKKNKKFENSLYDQGITAKQAKGAALDVAGEDKDWSMLAGRDVNDKIQVKDKLGIGGKKVKKWKDEKKHLASEERARFKEGGGGGSMFGNYNL